MHPSSLIAFKLNQRVLPRANGFPARALFPGWYGMDSVKWLRRIVIITAADRETPFETSGFNRVYNRVSAAGGTVRLAAVQVKSVVAWPANSFKLPAARYTVFGFAWSGDERIRKVSVSLNGGSSWEPAKLDSQASSYGWAKWTYDWNAAPGEYRLMSRATDAAGNQQPLRRDPARRDAYEQNWCVPIIGSVR
jgi:DMSO/TMAO reductase YedYZ molybdopterin-dependent catalytic subunit